MKKQIEKKPAGATLKQYRELRGIRQADLARRLGTNTPTLSKIETGKRQLPLHMAEKAAVILDIDPYQFFPELGNIRAKERELALRAHGLNREAQAKLDAFYDSLLEQQEKGLQHLSGKLLRSAH